MIVKLRFLILIIAGAAILSLFCLARLSLRVPVVEIPVVKEKGVPVWREDFEGPVYKKGKSIIPEGWVLKGKMGTPQTVFTVIKDSKENIAYLRMKADKSSGSIVTRFDGMDSQKTPILRWQWRAEKLPEGADGRVVSKDDQVIGIYIGTGTMLSQKSISYRWDTDTPKGTEGNCAYGGGTLKIKWYTLRDKDDLKDGQWYVEERNYLEDFKNAWGFYPKKLFLGIISNSQYTATNALGDIEWIELTAQ